MYNLLGDISFSKTVDDYISESAITDNKANYNQKITEYNLPIFFQKIYRHEIYLNKALQKRQFLKIKILYIDV